MLQFCRRDCKENLLKNVVHWFEWEQFDMGFDTAASPLEVCTVVGF